MFVSTSKTLATTDLYRMHSCTVLGSSVAQSMALDENV